MINIVFEAHNTTVDNERDISSGWNDPELSEMGLKQAEELRDRYKDVMLDAIFCSDLQRSYKTAELAFGNSNVQIIKDMRLREIDYGQMNGYPSDEVKAEKINRIEAPFPDGESYRQTSERMKSFLDELKRDYDGKTVMIIGHRATQYGLEHWIKGVSLPEAVTAPWKWQPGWVYTLI